MNNINGRSISVQRCPYLGLHDDRSTSLAYPSAWNYCYRAAPPASVLISHQVEACLCPLYTGCTIYISEKTRPLPSSLRCKTRVAVRKYGFPGKFGRAVLLFLVVALAIPIIFLSWNLLLAAERGASFSTTISSNCLTTKQPLNNDATTISNWIVLPSAQLNGSTETPGRVADEQNTDLPSTSVPRTNVSMQSADPSLTSLPHATGTLTLTPTPVGMCGHALDAPFGGDTRFVIHRVVSGENLTLYATKYETDTDHDRGDKLPSTYAGLGGLDYCDSGGNGGCV